jgi:hypothetical protein
MAINASPVSRDLILVMDNGLGASGQQLTRSRSYRDLKTTAGDEDIYAVAQALIGLQEDNCLAIQRRDIVVLQQV